MAFTQVRQDDVPVSTGDNRAAVGTFRAMVAAGSALLDVDQFSTARVRALKATLLADPTATNREALAIREDMYAAGNLPQEYVEWIPAFCRVLGRPTEF